MIQIALRRSLLLALALLACFLAGCKHDLNLAALAAEPIKVTTYLGKPGYTPEKKFTPPSREHRILAAWAARNTQDWEGSIASYVPGTTLYGQNYQMNILDDFVVLHLHEVGSYVRQLTPEDAKLLNDTFASK